MRNITLLLLINLFAFTAFAQDPDVGGTSMTGTVSPVSSPFYSGEIVTFDVQAGSSSGNLTFPAPGNSPFFVTLSTRRIANPVIISSNPNYFTVTVTQTSATPNAQLYSIVFTQNQTIPEGEYTTFTITGQAQGNAGQTIGYQANGTPGGYNSTNVGLDNPSWTGTIDIPLPVKLISFAAVKENNTALLNWATSEETNSDRFEVERSTTGKNWNRIGTVESFGESKVKREYQYIDAAPANGANYYRLKMVDKDETFAYSSIKNLELNGKSISVYPNPVSDVLFLKDVDAKNVKEVSIINVSGITAYKASSVSESGINVSSLNKGMYIVKVTKLDGTASSHKIVITK